MIAVPAVKCKESFAVTKQNTGGDDGSLVILASKGKDGISGANSSKTINIGQFPKILNINLGHPIQADTYAHILTHINTHTSMNIIHKHAWIFLKT